MTTVWPALLPPWYLTTYWTLSPRRSVALPFPSSPHWAPTSTMAGISIRLSHNSTTKPLRRQARQGLLRTESTQSAQVKPSPHGLGHVELGQRARWCAGSWQTACMSSSVNLLGEPPATLLPDVAEASALFAEGA